MAKIIVTGGAGFIGSHITDALLKDGHQVIVLDDLSSGSEANLSEARGAKLVRVDIKTAEARSIVEKEAPDAIVHAAAQISVRESMSNPHFDVETNVGGIVNLLSACRGDKKPHFIFISTGGAIYGEQDVFPAPESHRCQPASIYGLSKRVSEIYLDFWAREWGLKFSAMRLGNIYGPRQNPHGEAGVVAIFCKQLLNGKVPMIYGTGEQTRDFVFVKDVAQAVRSVIEKKVAGTFNIGTGRESSVNQVYAAIAAAISPSTKASYAPAKPGEQMRSCIDASLAQKSFGWKPQVTVEEGLKLTAQWFASQAAGK